MIDQARQERATEYQRMKEMWAWKDLERRIRARVETLIYEIDEIPVNELTPARIAEGRGMRLQLLEVLDWVDGAAGMRD